MLVEGLGFVNLLCTGKLAGEELAICYGVRGPLASLNPQPAIQLRQALIRRLRILVPVLFGLAFVSGIAVSLLDGFGREFGARCAGLACHVVFIAITLAGTVPINQAALTWEDAAPPEGWRAMVNRWERLDIARTWTAVVAFGLFLAAVELR